MPNNNYVLQEDILESIENIETIQMEAEMNVLNAMLQDYHKSIWIYENYQGDNIMEFPIFQECFIQEGFSDIVKKGLDKGKAILLKIWNIIKSLIVFISRQIARIIKFTKNLFKKGIKSADQIAIDCGIFPNNNSNVIIEAVKPINESNPSETITIPADEHSDIKPKSVRLTTKNLMIRFNKNGTFQITWFDIEKHAIKKIRSPLYNFFERIPSQSISPKDLHTSETESRYNGPIRYDPCFYQAMVYIIMQNPVIFDNLICAVSSVSKFVSGNITSVELSNSIESYNNKINNTYISENIAISLSQLIRFQSKISKLSQEMAIVKTADLNISDAYDFTLLQKFILDIEYLQMGLNGISGALKQPFEIDKRFKERVKSLNKLDEFVSECIRCGMPPKYIRNNVWIICDKSIKGDGTKRKPIWGQSRVVFIPNTNDKVVYKIALSGMGINANVNEFNISNNFKKYDNLINYIALVLNMTKHKTIVEMERTHIRYFNEDTVDKFINSLDKALLKNRIPFVISDIHEKNLGINESGRLVCFDYGMTLPTVK